MNYRPEVDGLRALAVLPVMLFHTGFGAFSGGFVGVDVFFVISGYLITGIIASELDAGRISIATFYERRARRILPALSLVTLSCVPLAWLWLLPSELKEFSDSLVAVPLFVSNILFWRQSGYFDTAAEFKPLLHTWSLGVEEQFYLLFPLFLLWGWRFGRQRLLQVLAAASMLSLLAAHWGALHRPAATFFLLPTRAWELAIGVSVAFRLMKQQERPARPAVDQCASLAGLLLVGSSVLAYSESTPFPSLYALAPTGGAALILLHAHPGTLVGRLLSGRALVSIGLISYSAYLWHQPLFAFARHRSADPPDGTAYAMLIALALGLAYLSWRFVEQPFRGHRQPSRKRVFQLAALASAAMLSVGLAGSLSRGAPSRFASKTSPVAALARIDNVYEHYDYRGLMRNATCHSVSMVDAQRNGCFDIRSKNLLLWGDSYAACLFRGLESARDARHPEYGIIQMTDGNGPPFYIDARTDDGKTLTEANDARLAMVRRHQPEVVLMTWMMDGKNGLPTPEASLLALNLTIEKVLAAAPRSEVVVLGPLPRWHGTLQKQLIDYYERRGRPPPVYSHHGLSRAPRLWDAMFSHRIPRPRVTYLSALSVLCNASGCLTRTSDDITDITALDWGHLTRNGSKRLVEGLEGRLFR